MMRVRRGFLLFDVLTGMFLIVTLAVALAATMVQQNRASQRIGDEREAVRLAERALVDLHRGAPIPVSNDVKQIEVRSLPDGWVSVSADVRGRHAQLIGRVNRRSSK